MRFHPLTALLSLLLVAPAAAQQQERTINVTGGATLSLKPDTGRLYFGIATVAPSLEAARSQNAATTQRCWRR